MAFTGYIMAGMAGMADNPAPRHIQIFHLLVIETQPRKFQAKWMKTQTPANRSQNTNPYRL